MDRTVNMDRYIMKDQKKLRCGYTTGSCAAGAAKGAAYMLLTGESVDTVEIDTPKGWPLKLGLVDVSRGPDWVSCAVEKDSGDDPDVTHGLLIYARARLAPEKGVKITGGQGVGRVTQRGLSLEVGQAAINPVPRAMMENEVLKIWTALGFQGGMEIEVSVPRGEEIAAKTFNPRLGIVDGISIIGTSGIVEPMSEQALVDSIKVEMKMRKENGQDDLLVFPGNYGETFARDQLGLDTDRGIKCSNYVGEVLDYGAELEFSRLLIVGHIGKMVKLAGGMMNLHSRNGDGRMEILAAHAALHGASRETVKGIMNCAMTDEAVEYIVEAGLKDEVFAGLAERAEFYADARVRGSLSLGVILFSTRHGLLGLSPRAEALWADWRAKAGG